MKRDTMHKALKLIVVTSTRTYMRDDMRIAELFAEFEILL